MSAVEQIDLMPGARYTADGLLERCCRQAHGAGWVRGFAEGVAAGRAQVEAEIHADAYAVVQSAARTPVVNAEMATQTSEQIALAAHDRQARGIARFRADHERRRREVVA